MFKKISLILLLVVLLFVLYFVLTSTGVVGKDSEVFEVRLQNVSNYDLGQGALVIHNNLISFNYLSLPAPQSFSDLLENDISGFAGEVEGNGLYKVIPTAYLSSGQSTIYEISGEEKDSVISVLIPIAETGAIAWISSQALFDENGVGRENRINAQIIGIEDNVVDHHSLHNESILSFELYPVNN